MTSRDFCYWLQGYFEVSEHVNNPATATAPVTLNAYQVELVRRHLALVFKHEIDPSFGGPEVQAALNETHTTPSGPLFNRPPGVRC